MNMIVSPAPSATPNGTTRPQVHIVIVGHVDHGKSTLVGRLLHETGSRPDGKLEMLNQLIAQELLLAKARELKIEVTDTELDNAFNEAKKNITEDQFQKELASRNLTPADMREGLRRDMLANKVMEREVTAKIAVTDDDSKTFCETNRASCIRTDDADLQLRTPAELKNELEEGLRVTADDFNPLRVLRERK